MPIPRSVRPINQTRVLDALFRSGPMSRADLARALGLMRSTAGSLVSTLAAEGVVLDHGHDPAGRANRPAPPTPARAGRPGSQVRLNPRHAFFLGAEIGIGHLTVVALDLSASIVGHASGTFDIAEADPETVIDQLVGLIRPVVARLRAPGATQSLGVAIPGLLDHDGTVLRAPILGWRKVPILRILHAKLPKLRTIAAENDANAFAVAALYRAGNPASADALYMLIDAGVGGGIVSNGTLLRGHRGYAGEIGHILLGEHGYAEQAALPGSLESFVGRQAVLDRHRFHGGAGETLEHFLTALQAGSPAAAATLRDWSHHLGRGIATLIGILDPAAIVLGGPVAVLHAHARDDILASIRNHLLANHPLPTLMMSSLGPDGPAIGAASMMHRRMFALDEDFVFNSDQN